MLNVSSEALITPMGDFTHAAGFIHYESGALIDVYLELLRRISSEDVSASCGHLENVDSNGRKMYEAKVDENDGLSKEE